MIDLDKLKAEFPREIISWRAQSMNKEGTSAMALAYIDARDVMERLDAVCGPENWQCRYPHAGAKTVCEIGIRIGDEWVWKADGAGDSDIEAEKGALSDALKRAAVRWGVGRYLYFLASPWVNCESYTNHQGKKVWKRWTEDPWSKVRNSNPAPTTGRAAAPATNAHTEAGAASNDAKALDKAMRFAADNAACASELRTWWIGQLPKAKELLPTDMFEELKVYVARVAGTLPEERKVA